MVKILFVCLGNICRSPLAQGIMEKKIKEAGLDKDIEVDSCGTSQYHIGEQPDERTLRNARNNNVRLNHQARQFSNRDFKTFDYIIVMDRANRDCVQRLDQENAFSDKLFLMRDFDSENPGADVPDPFFGGEEGFQDVYQIIDRSVDALLSHVVKEHRLKLQVD